MPPNRCQRRFRPLSTRALRTLKLRALNPADTSWAASHYYALLEMLRQRPSYADVLTILSSRSSFVRPGPLKLDFGCSIGSDVEKRAFVGIFGVAAMK